MTTLYLFLLGVLLLLVAVVLYTIRDAITLDTAKASAALKALFTRSP